MIAYSLAIHNLGGLPNPLVRRESPKDFIGCGNLDPGHHRTEGDAMRRLLIPLIALMLIAGGCQFTVVQYASSNGYVACVLSGIEAKDKPVEEVTAAGMASVRVGNCNGAAVSANILVMTELWYHAAPNLNLLCGQTDWTGSLSAESVTALATIATGQASCPSTYTGGSWFSRSYAHAWIFGVEYAGGAESPYETR